jgi:hypothetical protein
MKVVDLAGDMSDDQSHPTEIFVAPQNKQRLSQDLH